MCIWWLRDQKILWPPSSYFKTSKLFHLALRATCLLGYQSVLAHDSSTRKSCDVTESHSASGSSCSCGTRSECFMFCQDSACIFEHVCKTLLVLVSLHVQGKVIRSGEGAWADATLEGFGARVFPVVTRQLIRTSKTPVAAVPRTPVRLLACRTGERVWVSANRRAVWWSILSYRLITRYEPEQDCQYSGTKNNNYCDTSQFSN